MKERWNLIQSGIDRPDIKVRGFCLLVQNKVYAQFRLGAVVRVEQVALVDQTGSRPAEADVTLREDSEVS